MLSYCIMNVFFFFLCIAIFGITTVNWVVFNPELSESMLATAIYQVDRMMNLDDDASFSHNFCESRLQFNRAPEKWNAWTSLIISLVPFVYGFPKYPLLYNVACMLSVNGLASFHYHYYLTWMGKQGDEISMILANYFGMWGLINMYYKKSERRNNLNRYNTAFMYLFLVSNTIIQHDSLFPSIFGIYVGGTLVMIYRVAQMHNIPYKKNLAVSFVGASCWIVSEHYCNEYTKFGHPLWHLLFPLGFYKLILDYDKIKEYRSKSDDKLSIIDESEPTSIWQEHA